jgi:hypothetical protein
VLFEETRKTLFCSDLFHHFGSRSGAISYIAVVLIFKLRIVSKEAVAFSTSL